MKNDSQNLYDILGVSKDATEEEIKKAYREKAIKTHPDKGGDAEEFAALSAAYEVLSDKEKRKRYDETGVTDNMSDKIKSAVGHVRQLFSETLKEVTSREEAESFGGWRSVYSSRTNTGNISSIVQTAIKKEITDTKNCIDSVDDKIKQMEKQVGRVGKKKKQKHNEVPNLYDSVVREMLENAKNYKAQVEAKLEVLKIAAEIANDYEDVAVKEEKREEKKLLQFV